MGSRLAVGTDSISRHSESRSLKGRQHVPGLVGFQSACLQKVHHERPEQHHDGFALKLLNVQHFGVQARGDVGQLVAGVTHVDAAGSLALLRQANGQLIDRCRSFGGAADVGLIDKTRSAIELSAS